MKFEQTTPAKATSALQQQREQLRETKAGSRLRFELPAPEIERSLYSSPVAQRVRPGAAQARVSLFNLTRSEQKSKFSLREREGSQLRYIDMNADCGEGFDDAGLLEYVTSVNVACGAHVESPHGDPEAIAKVVHMAAEKRACIGAHVSFVDKENFGRTQLDTSPAELREQVLWQASALDGLCRGAGTRVRYIKPHGALYHATMAGGEQGQAVFEAAQALQLPLLLMPRSAWATYGEGFAERAYDGDSLRPRDQEGAVIHEPHLAAQQAVTLAARTNLHSICVHGDSPNAVEVAKAVRGALEKEGYSIKPFAH